MDLRESTTTARHFTSTPRRNTLKYIAVSIVIPISNASRQEKHCPIAMILGSQSSRRGKHPVSSEGTAVDISFQTSSSNGTSQAHTVDLGSATGPSGGQCRTRSRQKARGICDTPLPYLTGRLQDVETGCIRDSTRPLQRGRKKPITATVTASLLYRVDETKAHGSSSQVSFPFPFAADLRINVPDFTLSYPASWGGTAKWDPPPPSSRPRSHQQPLLLVSRDFSCCSCSNSSTYNRRGKGVWDRTFPSPSRSPIHPVQPANGQFP